MSHHPLQRIIGTFESQAPGPLLIVMGALHGNEPAGVRALELVFEALELERRDNPDFQFSGKILGIIGHAQAFLLRQRFLEHDLNRVWTPEFVKAVTSAPSTDLNAEDQEVRELFDLISQECETYRSTSVIFLDLHTTSADGGIFSIPTDESESLELAKHLGAPAILGLQDSIPGTLLGFAKAGGFGAEAPIRCVAFEAGQHESEHAIARAAIAIVRCLRAVGSIGQHELIHFTESLSLPFMAYVPSVVRFRYAHHIEAEDHFKMRPGYANFQPIMQGEHLADDVHGPVRSPEQGLILMPLYQAKGSDGFFIVR